MKTAASSSVNLIFRAFSDPTRLRILYLLRGGEMCVGDLVAVLKIPQPTASRHLAYLRLAGLVTNRKAGLWIYYALRTARGTFHRKLLECLRTCFRDVPRLASDEARAKKIRKKGGCCPS